MISDEVHQRAKLSLGTSSDAIYQMVHDILASKHHGSARCSTWAAVLLGYGQRSSRCLMREHLARSLLNV